MKSKLIYGEIIAIGVETYFEFLISGYLAPTADILTTNGEIISTILGWTVLIIALFLLPITLLWILSKPLHTLQDPDFIKSFKPFFAELSSKSKIKLSYFFVFMIRRISFVAVSIFVESPSLQTISILYMNLIIVIFIGLSKPFARKLRNIIEFVNEGLVSVTCFHLLVFTDYVPDKYMQYRAGYSMLMVLFVLILFNMWFVFINGARLIYLVYLKYKRIIVHKALKWLEEREDWDKPQVYGGAKVISIDGKMINEPASFRAPAPR